MSQIVSRVTFTITVFPRPDGTAQIETRADPPNADVLMLCQAMLGVMTQFLLQVQQGSSSMLVRQKPQQEGEGDGA